jgi:hypothetical protein
MDVTSNPKAFEVRFETPKNGYFSSLNRFNAEIEINEKMDA